MSLRAFFAKQPPAKRDFLLEEIYPFERRLLRREERPPRNDMNSTFPQATCISQSELRSG